MVQGINMKIGNTTDCWLITLILCYLKINAIITWSWWIIFLPVIIPVGILLVCLLVFGIVKAIIYAKQ